MGLLLSVCHYNERTGTRYAKGSELAPLKRGLRVSKLARPGAKRVSSPIVDGDRRGLS